jgi:hypothetical protein
MVKLYLVTDYGTLVGLTYSLAERHVAEIQVSTYIK